MAVISNITVLEHRSEKDGRRYVTYTFTSEYGDKIVKTILEEAHVDVAQKAVDIQNKVLAELAQKEKDAAYALAITDGVNPADLVYKYNDKAAIINDMYSSKLEKDEQAAANALTKTQNVVNKVRLFLGLI